MIPSVKQCENWLTRKYGLIINCNISGCPWFGYVKRWFGVIKNSGRKSGFPDKFIPSILSFIEIKRGDEKLTDDQKDWLGWTKGFVYRFWDDHVDIYNSDLEIIGSIKYHDET